MGIGSGVFSGKVRDQAQVGSSSEQLEHGRYGYSQSRVLPHGILGDRQLKSSVTLKESSMTKRRNGVALLERPEAESPRVFFVGPFFVCARDSDFQIDDRNVCKGTPNGV